MKVKIVFGSDMRRWHMPNTNQFESLIEFVKQTFDFPDGQDFYLQFQDDEGDRMTISTASDFYDALMGAKQENRKSLKIYLMQGSIKQAQRSFFDTSSIISRDDQFDMCSNNQSSQNETHTAPQQPTNSPNNNMTSSKIPSQNSSYTCREALASFVADTNLRDILPCFVKMILSCLRNQTRSLSSILIEVLHDSRFIAIAQHELFTKYVMPNLNCLDLRAATLIPVLLTFDDNTICSLIPQLIDTAEQMIAGVRNVEFDVTPIFATLFPTWLAMMSANTPSQGCSINLCDIFGTTNPHETAEAMMNHRESKEDDNNNNARHIGITCDVCESTPIRGARYKCCICSNYDMCQSCEAKGSHNKSHPLLKLSEPASSLFHGDADGLREIFGRPWRFRRFFRGPWHGHGRGHHNPHFRHHERSRKCGNRNNCNWEPFSRYNCHESDRGNSNFDTSSVKSDSCSTIPSFKLKAEFIEDVNFFDRTSHPKNTVLQKKWRMRNSGQIEWGNNCELIFVRGNRCLALEERYPVPNAQPGEIVEVTAILKTPDELNRYCTYFRLQCNKIKFGPRVWVDIFVIDPNEPQTFLNKTDRKKIKNIEKLEKKRAKIEEKLRTINRKVDMQTNAQISNNINTQQEGSRNILCVCGSALIKTSASSAYHGSNRIYCDICGKLVEREVYHCSVGKNVQHPSGYDLCLNCADLQMQSFNQPSSKQSLQEKQPSQNQSEPSQPVKGEDTVSCNLPKQPQKKPQEKQQQQQQPSIDKLVSSTNPPIEQQIPFVELIPDTGFPYQEKLQILQSMGFTDVPVLQYLLMQHKGEVDRVLQQLIE